jgi:uncharacterized caspase-like protein
LVAQCTLVLGNAGYEAGALKTTANDAGLVAQTLEAAGFEVIGARDLDHDALRRTFRDFIDKAAALGPDDVAVVYVGGYGLQLEGENYFVPIDARIERVSDVPIRAVRLSDYTRTLAALKLKISIVILDLARGHPFATNEPMSGGLALVEPEQGMLVAFNAAPGTIAPPAEGDYGAYAKALAEMMREGGLPLNELFDRVRLRVSDATLGAQVPWHASNVAGSFVFFERTADTPPSVAANEVSPATRSRAIRDLGAQEAYIAALERDTLPGYLEFLDSYASDPLADRVRAIVAARREALIWRRTRSLDTPAAYWSYLRLYSDGPHAGEGLLDFSHKSHSQTEVATLRRHSPRLLAVSDRPVAQRRKSTLCDVSINDGLHVHGILVVPWDSRLKTDVVSHFQKYERMYVKNRLLRLDVRPIEHNLEAVVDYAFKSVKRKKCDPDYILLFPKAHSELRQGPRTEGDGFWDAALGI